MTHCRARMPVWLALAALCAVLATAGGARAQATAPPLQFGYIDRFNDPAAHNASRTYFARGAFVSLVVEMTNANGDEIAFSQPAMPLTSSRPVRRIVINWFAIRPCWAVGVASADPALTEVWHDPACQRVYFPTIGN